jgi:hypothetical protein
MTFAEAVQKAIDEDRGLTQVFPERWSAGVKLRYIDINPPDGRGFYLEIENGKTGVCIYVRYSVTAADVTAGWETRT